jgi:hypothetical protein
MTKILGSVGLATLLLFVGGAVFWGEAGQLVCYQWSDSFPNERYKLDIQTHSLLSEVKQGHAEEPQQLVFSVFGKHVGTCGGDTVRPVVGSLISTSPIGEPFQARLGLVSFNTTGAPIFCRDVEVSCKAAQWLGFPPPVWDCFGESKFGVEFAFQLRQVDESKDPRCGLFEDGTSNEALQGLYHEKTPASGRAAQ